MGADAIAALFAGLAVLVAVGAFIRGELNARAGQQDVAAAQAAATEANEAALRSAAAQERLAELFAGYLSRAEKRDLRQWGRRPPRGDIGYETKGGPMMGSGPSTVGRSEPRVHWTVDKIKGGLHTLTNIGQATAYDVTLSCENAARFDAPEPRPVKMGENVEFRALGSWQTGTPELVVTWRDTSDGARRTWQRLLP